MTLPLLARRAGRLRTATAICALVGATAIGFAQPPVTEQSSESVDTAIRQTLRRYETALESLDPEAVRKIHPTVRTESLAKAFRDMQELKVDIDEVRVLSVDGALARVSCRVVQELTPRVGSRQTSTVKRVLRFTRESGGWVIQGFER